MTIERVILLVVFAIAGALIWFWGFTAGRAHEHSMWPARLMRAKEQWRELARRP